MNSSELTDGNSLIRLLQTRTAPGSLQSLPVADLLQDATNGSEFLSIMLHANGHVLLLLGTITVDGQVLFQVLHGSMPPSLVPKAQLRDAGFIGAWKLRKAADGVRLKVGTGLLAMGNCFHNFREVKPDDHVECTFNFKNVGHTALVIDEPRLSCSCVGLSGWRPPIINPGESKTLRFTIDLSNALSMRQSASLTFFRRAARHRATSTSLFSRLNLIDADCAATTRCRRRCSKQELFAYDSICGILTDRFVIKHVDTHTLPISYRLEESKDQDGLATYQLELQLKPIGFVPGEHAGSLEIVTNSALRSRVVYQFASPSPPL